METEIETATTTRPEAVHIPNCPPSLSASMNNLDDQMTRNENGAHRRRPRTSGTSSSQGPAELLSTMALPSLSCEGVSHRKDVVVDPGSRSPRPPFPAFHCVGFSALHPNCRSSHKEYERLVAGPPPPAPSVARWSGAEDLRTLEDFEEHRLQTLFLSGIKLSLFRRRDLMCLLVREWIEKNGRVVHCSSVTPFSPAPETEPPGPALFLEPPKLGEL